MRLKRQQGQDADDEELQAAITHAKTMERVAKKKVMHLEQEEMAERTRKAKEFEENQSAKTADISILSDEDEKAENTDLSEAKLPEGKLLEGRLSGTELSETELSEAELSEIEISEAEYEDAFDMMEAVSNLEELGAEFLEELGNELSEAQMEEMGLSDFSDSAKAARGDMSSEDLKLLKVKHRNKEMKEIVKADAEYLKVVFDKLQAESSADKVNVEPQNISPDMSGSIAGGMTGSIPGETISAAFDISI